MLYKDIVLEQVKKELIFNFPTKKELDSYIEDNKSGDDETVDVLMRFLEEMHNGDDYRSWIPIMYKAVDYLESVYNN